MCIFPYLISSTGVTPKTFNPDPITNPTACTNARRARVSSASPSTTKRSAGSVAAAVPMGMEGGGEVVEIEGDAVRFMRRGGGLDLARPLGDQADQRELAGIAQTVERRAVQPVDRDAGGARLAHDQRVRAHGHTGHTRPGYRVTVLWP